MANSLIENNVDNKIGIVETGDTCTHSGGIAAGQYVIWKGVLYTASAAINEGEAFVASGSNENLTVVDGGGLNAVLKLFANYAKECTWVTGGTSTTGNVKAASYPTGYNHTNCYIDSAYFYFSTNNEYYALPNGVVTVILKYDGIYVSTQQATFTGENKFHFLLRKL